MVYLKLKHINLMNVLMCFSVVSIHLTSNPVTALRKDSIWYFLFFVVNKFLTFAVPAFIFLSGFKLFNKYKDTHIDLKKFYLGRFRKIVIPYFIAFFVYFIFYKSGNLVQWKDFLSGLFLGTLVAHFYYIIIAIQFYVIFPVLNYLFKKGDKFLLAISFASTIALNQFIHFEYSDRFFATYIFYFILGMFVAKYYTEKKTRLSLLYLSVFLPLSIVHIYLSYKMSLGGFWYRNSGIVQVIYVTLASLLIYNLCIKISNTKVERFANYINPHTFYIFLYHILVMNIMQFVIYPHFNFSVKYQFFITSSVVLGAIFVYCWIRNSIKIKIKPVI